jgi:serine/threonine protein kinase
VPTSSPPPPPRLGANREVVGRFSGSDLSVADDRRIPAQLLLQLAREIAKGMNFLHMMDPPLIHRDLKVRSPLDQNFMTNNRSIAHNFSLPFYCSRPTFCWTTIYLYVPRTPVCRVCHVCRVCVCRMCRVCVPCVPSYTLCVFLRR